MENKNVITVVNEEGQEQQAEVLLVFKLVDNGPEYMIYTFNEKDENGLMNIYCSTFVEKEDGYSLEDIKTDEEWAEIKEVMRKVINENKE